jgi:hypothetical protein
VTAFPRLLLYVLLALALAGMQTLRLNTAQEHADALTQKHTAEMAQLRERAATALAEATTAAREQERVLQAAADERAATYEQRLAAVAVHADAARADLERVRRAFAAAAHVPASGAGAGAGGAGGTGCAVQLSGLAELCSAGAGLVEEGSRRVEQLDALMPLCR